MLLFDTHAHLDQEEFDADRDAAVERARAVGVQRIVTVGTTLSSSEAAVRIAGQYAEIFASVGLQPNYCGQAAASDWDAIVRLAESPRVVALGETGLDRYWDYTPFDVQQDYFDRHLKLSLQRGLPVVIHTRECDDDVLTMLRAARLRGPLRGVMHSFSGSAETAAECAELGLYISFAGMVTFKKSDALRSVAADVPDDRIVIETDSPYLSPHPLRGRRNEPAHLEHTARCLAEVRGVSVEEFARQTSENARRLFGVA